VLLKGARTDVELPGDLFVAATLSQQPQNVFITGRDFDGIEIDRYPIPPGRKAWFEFTERHIPKQCIRQTFAS
jgi:hypothetical protein